MLETFTIDTFRPLTDGSFVLRAGDAELPLVLTEVRALGAQHPMGTRSPFALLFRGPADPVLAQATYVVEHPELGAPELFLVPVGRTDAGAEYEAIFT